MDTDNSWKIVCKVLACYLTIVVFAGIHQIQASTKRYQATRVELPSNIEDYKIFTDEEIAKYDGSDESLPLYMAVKGVVFDVSSGSGFYAKGKPYNALIGKDATRAVAKMSLEKEDLNSNTSDLSDGIIQALDDVYKSTYLEKYPIVGYMDYLLEDRRKPIRQEDL